MLWAQNFICPNPANHRIPAAATRSCAGRYRGLAGVPSRDCTGLARVTFNPRSKLLIGTIAIWAHPEFESDQRRLAPQPKNQHFAVPFLASKGSVTLRWLQIRKHFLERANAKLPRAPSAVTTRLLITNQQAYASRPGVLPAVPAQAS